MTRDDATDLKRKLEERLEQVVDHFWPGNIKRGHMAYPIPGKVKTDLGSFQVYLAARGKYSRGSWVRSSSGAGGDVINLFAYGLSGSQSHRADALVFEEIRRWLGISNEPESEEARQRREEAEKKAADKQKRDAERQARDAARKAATVKGICEQIVPIAGTEAERYLLGRGIPKPPDGWPDYCIGFHRGLEWELGAEYDDFRGERIKVKDGPIFSALVARVVDIGNETIAVWRIFLLDGKKAPVANPKLGLGPSLGGAIRIGGVGPVTGAAEGFESAMGAWSLIRYRHPVWSCMSTAGMIGVEMPMEVEVVPIFLDGDKSWKRENGVLVPSMPPGRGAALRLQARMLDEGREAPLQPEPPVGKDYLNIWNKMQGTETL